MAPTRGLLQLALGCLLAVHLGSILECDTSHPTRPEQDLSPWGHPEEEPSFLMTSPQPQLLLGQKANSSATKVPMWLLSGPPEDAAIWEPKSPTALPLPVTLKVLPDASSPPYEEGSMLTLEASVKPQSHWAMKLYVDVCVGSLGPFLSHSQRMFILVFNQGCLSIGHTPGAWSRQANERLQFQVAAFTLRDHLEEDEVYITCWVRVWSSMRPFEPGRKSCFFNVTSDSWQLSEDASESKVCECCDFGCYYPTIERHEFPEEGFPNMVVAGPLKVKKSPEPWFKAPCRTLKELLFVGLAFSSVTVLLIFSLVVLVLLILKKGLLPYLQSCNLGFLGNRQAWTPARLDPEKSGLVVMRRFSSQEHDDDEASQRVSEEIQEAEESSEDTF